MPPRPLTQFENPIANAVVELGNLKQWEFAAFLQSPNGPLIEMQCGMRDDGADPSQDVHNIAATGSKIVIHHNHLSQESLSFPDWNGLATVFDETFAHCADGTRYWGRVIDHVSVERINQNPVIPNTGKTIVDTAVDKLFHCLNAIPNAPLPANLAYFFRKEVVNRAMRLNGFVEYEYFWGASYVTPYSCLGAPKPPGSAGIIGTGLQQYIDQAANALAKML